MSCPVLFPKVRNCRVPAGGRRRTRMHLLAAWSWRYRRRVPLPREAAILLATQDALLEDLSESEARSRGRSLEHRVSVHYWQSAPPYISLTWDVPTPKEPVSRCLTGSLS